MANWSASPDPTGQPPADGAASLSRRQVLASLPAAGVGTWAASSPATAAARTGRPTAASHQSQGGDRLREEAWVETPVDTNDSGDPDRIHVRISRPESTEDGAQLPVIATASPYYGEQTHGDSTPEMRYDRAVELRASGESEAAGQDSAIQKPGSGQAGPPDNGPQHRLQRPGSHGVTRDAQVGAPSEYVHARIAALGTGQSTGCYTAAGPPTIAALEAVVDWFNGRATAYASRTGDTTVEADWTNGRTGLIGGSAEGELANGLATTGVDGLEAIVAKAANNGHYSLFRSNGTPISVVPTDTDRLAGLGSWIAAGNARRPDCGHWTEIAEAGQDRATGDYNDFWHEREFLPHADDVDCGVLLSHAVDDPIVKPNNSVDWYEELAAADVPVRLWLHTGGHSSPRSQAWGDLVGRWWDYWLKDDDNGVVDEPAVTVDHGRSTTGDSLRRYESWPVPDSRETPVRLSSGGQTAGTVTVGDAAAGTESFVDDPTTSARELAAAEESAHRLRYETPPLGESVHVSGIVVPDLTVSFDDPTVLSVALVEYADQPRLVTRGWVDPLNRPSYSEFDSPVAYKQSLRESSPGATDEQLQVEFPLQATDYVFEAGSRIGLVVYGSDREYTLHPPGNSTVTVALGESAVTLPVVGGEGALDSAFEPGADEMATTTTNGGSGPGFGVGGALAALGSAGTLLRRRVNRDA